MATKVNGNSSCGTVNFCENVTEIRPIICWDGRASRPLKPTPPSPRQIPFKFMQPPTSIPFDMTVEVTQIELSLSKTHFWFVRDGGIIDTIVPGCANQVRRSKPVFNDEPVADRKKRGILYIARNIVFSLGNVSLMLDLQYMLQEISSKIIRMY